MRVLHQNPTQPTVLPQLNIVTTSTNQNLQLLVKHLNDPSAGNIARTLSENGWKWLRKDARKLEHTYESDAYFSTPSPLAAHAMEWMVQMSRRLIGKEPGPANESSAWLFFQHASQTVSEGCGWLHVDQAKIEEFARNLSAKDLFDYDTALSHGIKSRMIQWIIQNQPRMMADWLLMLESTKNWNQRYRIVKLFEEFNLIPTIFSGTKGREVFEISVYGCLPHATRKRVLQHMYTNHPAALCNWVYTSLRQYANYPVQEDCVHLFGVLADDFFALLQEIDPSYPLKLTDQVRERILPIKELKLLFLLLPVGLNLNDPAVKQGFALVKLREQFTTIEVSHEDRKRFVQGIYDDLKGTDSNWLEKIFKTLPENTWPLFFLYFSDRYYDWVGRINCSATALIMMANTPYFISREDPSGITKTDWAMQYLYDLAIKTNSLDQILRKFAEKATPNTFVVVMNIFSRFFPHRETFCEDLANAINSGKIYGKDHFLASCMVLAAGVEKKNSNFLAQALWKKPFINDVADRATVAKHVVDLLPDHFIYHFSIGNMPRTMILESIRITDYKFGVDLFHSSLTILCGGISSEEYKLRVFQNFCRAYGDVGYDVDGLLDSKEAEEALPLIKSWYQLPLETLSLDSVTEVRLLKRFTGDKFFDILNRYFKTLDTTDKNHFLDILKICGVQGQFLIHKTTSKL